VLALVGLADCCEAWACASLLPVAPMAPLAPVLPLADPAWSAVAPACMPLAVAAGSPAPRLALPLGMAPVSGERAPEVDPMVPPSLELVVPDAPLEPRAPSVLPRQLLQADRPSASVSMPVKTTVGYSRFMIHSLWMDS
jgi:hypothetical protein